MVFMVLLLFQSTFNVFANHTITGDAGSIDIIIRTSTAAIFGYFLSTNFIRHASSSSPNGTESGTKNVPAESSGEIQNHIGFSAQDTNDIGNNLELGGASGTRNPEPDHPDASRLQIITAAVIGLFCLVVLMLLRNISLLSADTATSSSATATVSQFRDIVSGCIGFLIGCPTSKRN